MSIVATLLDKARARKNISSDNALAQQLGTNRQVVSQWRHGDSYPSEDNIAELAEMAGDDPVQWLVAIKAVRADGKAGKAWAALAKRLAFTTALLVCVFGVSAKPTATTVSGFEKVGNVYYVKTLAAAVRYHVGLLKLLLASLLPLRGSKDKASIDACAST